MTVRRLGLSTVTGVTVVLALAGPTPMAAAAPSATTATSKLGTWTARLAGPKASDLQKAMNERWEDPIKMQRQPPPTTASSAQPTTPAPESRAHERRQERKIQTCRDLLALTKDWKPRGEASALGLQNQSGRCRALARLIEGHTARMDFIGPLPLDQTLLDRLPATLIPAAGDEEMEDLQKAATAGVSWRGREPTLHVVDTRPNEVTLESDETRAIVSVLARCDVDGDDIEDVVIQRSGGGTGGTWGITEIFVLTRRSAAAKGPLEIISQIE
jgi:hypothetical protein